MRYHSTVIRALRPFVFLISFAALQLTLLGGGPGCPLPGASRAASMSMRGMAGMGDRRAAATDARIDDARVPAPPCDDSSADQACRTMAPCLFAASPSCSAAIDGAPTATPVRATSASVPHSVTAAPELPPPRA